MLITYQKKNGEIFQRVRNTYSSYRIGDITSMGWKVLDIQYRWKNKYYSSSDYDKITTKHFDRAKKINKIKKIVVKVYRELAYSLILLILFRFLELLLTKSA